MTIVFALGFKSAPSIPQLSVLLFIANSAGYFLGSAINDFVGGRPGMLLWGVIYGLLLGSGIAAVLHLLQKPKNVL
jgi:F0F1-type ATP synthase assembly protein I